MKKILTLALTGLIALGGSGMAVAATAASETLPAAKTQTAAVEQGNLYLVPGTYMSEGVKVENSISAGAQKLTKEQCDVIFTENAYLCTLAVGETLPVPASERVDKSGEKYAFNGWWAIVDATVTYFDKVPEISEKTFLYADWRADLSQRKDPVAPEPGVEVEPNHYLMIKRAETGETEKIILRKSGTDVSSAMDLGYGYAVQLLNQITLNAGDVIAVYTTGLDKTSEEPVIAPIGNHLSREIQLESNGTGTNRTADFLTADSGSARRTPSMTVNAGVSGKFNIYIKFFGGGSTMAVYMEPSA